MRMLKDAARALSLANLCFIAVWGELLSGATPWQVGFSVYATESYAAIMINVLLLAAVFWAGITVARRVGNRFLLDIAQLALPLVLLVVINGLIALFLPMQRSIIELIIILLAIGVIVLFDFGRVRAAIVRGAATIVLVLFPFFLVTTFQALRGLASFSAEPATAESTVGSAPVSRVLWLLFDELDQQVAFSSRPATLDLPELDRLRDECFYASNAYPPADDTLLSIPALINGRLISKVEQAGTNQLLITFADEDSPVDWSTQPNVFSRARETGLNTSLIGWYLPYCRFIGNSLTNCSWQESEGVTLQDGMFGQFERLIDSIPLMPVLTSRIGVLRNTKATHKYTGILEAAKRAAVDPGLGLILVHWPVPHPPGIYDRDKAEFDFSGRASYLDNLSLVDRTLGEVRRVMEEAGMWDSTVVLVTSDHRWKFDYWRATYFWTKEDEATQPRQADHRVPFLLKLAGQKEGVVYDGAFNTIVTHDLLLGLLKGERTNTESVVGLLEERGSGGERVDQLRIR